MPKPTPVPPQASRLTGRPRATLPPAGDWLVETGRSLISFSGRASRFAPTIHGRLGAVQGGLHLAADLERSRVGVCVDVRTVKTGNALWDDMLRVADPFRAAHHPQAHYASTSVRWTGTDFSVEGVLEIGGAQAPLSLTAAVSENADASVTLHAAGSFDPQVAGIALDIPGARLLMPRSITLSIAVIAVRTREPLRVPSKPACTASRRFVLAS